jgi:hypothetical protein
MTKIISDAHMEALENMERAGVRYERILIIASGSKHCQYSKPCRWLGQLSRRTSNNGWKMHVRKERSTSYSIG